MTTNDKYNDRYNPKPKTSKLKKIILTIAGIFFVLFIILPITFSFFNSNALGNVALIPVEGVLTTDGGSYLGSSTVSSKTIVNFIKDAEDNKNIQAILLEINCPGGSPVATDEIATAIKSSKKPTIALIREYGASGGYWIASASDYIIANRMSLTGSIGVLSSYIEFSGLMEKFGVGYERINAGKYKDLGSPYRNLTDDEKGILQDKADKLHDFFIREVAENRGLSEDKVRVLATGEAYLGSEALEYGLIDALGNRDTAENVLKDKYGLKEIEYHIYRQEPSLKDILSGSFTEFSTNMGKGIGYSLTENNNYFMLH